MVHDGEVSLFDPNRLEVPGLEQLIAQSSWLGEIPGLDSETRSWMADVPARQPALMRRAHRLSRTRVDPKTVTGEGRVAANMVLVAVSDLLSTVFGPRRRGRDAKRSAARIERLVRAGGPAWVKLGQFIATADGLVPEEWVEAFAWCRDEVPHLAPDVPRRIIRKTFGRPVDELFASFEDQPIGAASIAQVHAATLPDGREVVVKIRRPHLRRRFAADIRAMAAAAWVGERLHPIVRAGNPTGFVDLFAQLVLEELDFRVEALNMVELGLVAEACGSEHVRFPRPIPGLVTDRVIVMERLPGVAYTSAEVDGDVGQRLLRFAIQSVLEHTLIYGVFHGDRMPATSCWMLMTAGCRSSTSGSSDV